MNGNTMAPPPRRPYWPNLANLRQIAGVKGIVFFVSTVPLGLLQGLVEVAFGIAILELLRHFELIQAETTYENPFDWMHPIALLLIVAVLAAILRICCQVIPGLANETVNARVRNAITIRMLGSIKDDTSLTVADVSHLIGQLAPRSGAFFQAAASVLAAGCLLLILLATMFKLSFLLTGIVLASMACISIPIYLSRRFYERYSDQSYRNISEFGRGIIKAARNIHFLKVIGAAQQQQDGLLHVSTSNIEIYRKYISLFSSVSNIPILFGVCLIIAIISINHRYELLPVATLVPFIYLVNRLAGSMQTFSTSVGFMRHHRPYVMELMEFVPELFAAHEPAAGSGEPGPLANLNVRNLNVGRNEILLDGVSFDVAKGETLLITGTSGRGKTTLLMSLIGIIDNLGGDVFWDGTQIEKIDPAKMRRQTGYAGAEPYLIAGSIRENLLFGVEHIAYSDAQIKEALWGACAEFVYDSPDGLDHMLKENGDGISAGQKQRLSLARCLLRKPGVLLLDEATANVDEETEGRLMGRIRDLLPDSIILMISHRSSLTRFADRILPLDGLPADDRAEAVSVGG